MNDSPAGTKTRDALVAALTFAAGLIDALSFLALGGAFSSFMSGNTVLLGLRIGLGDFPLALNSMVAIIAQELLWAQTLDTKVRDRIRFGRMR